MKSIHLKYFVLLLEKLMDFKNEYFIGDSNFKQLKFMFNRYE
jgi:hypothetical protein